MANDGKDSFVFTIHLVHGEPLKFSLGMIEAKTKLLGLNDDLERALTRNAMAVEIDNKLLIIPYTNIKQIECDPSPPELPFTIIRGATSLPD